MNRHVVEERLYRAIFNFRPLELLKIDVGMVVFVALAVHYYILRLVLEAMAHRITNVCGLCNYNYR